jgi:hypothetical protein
MGFKTKAKSRVEIRLEPLRPAFCDDQAGLNRLSQANLVGQNATAFAEVTKCENYGVNLVRIWINTRLALRGGIMLALIRRESAG